MEYQHGGDIYTNSVTMDYSANINPLGLPRGVREAILRTIDTCCCYPDSRNQRLRERIATFHRIEPEEVICGNGAADLIFQIVQARKPKEALLLAPSFAEYEQALHAVGCKITYYDLKASNGFMLSLQELAKWLKWNGKEIQMLFLCNPNNPTGLVVTKEEIEDLLIVCKEQGIFCVVDECFNEFLDEPERYSILSQIQSRNYDHVFLLKAFTKIYAMAGIRLGYGICKNVSVLDQMNEIRQPWSVSSFAQAAGEAALLETGYVEETRALISAERAYLKEMLKNMGFCVFDSKANYIFFRDTREEACKKEQLLYKELLQKKVLIRSCSNYRGLDDTYYRICVKKRKENERFLAVLKSIITEGK